MRRSGRIVRQVLEAARDAVAPGCSTMDLERVAERKIRDLGAKPAFKGYYDYPCVLCVSVNNEIVHGIPSERRVLKDGDIVSLDCGVVLDGYYGDAAITVPVGDGITPELQKLLNVTQESLAQGIEAARVRKYDWRCGLGRAAVRRGERLQRGAGICRTRDWHAVA